MELKTLLITVRPRETSGARTSDRYDFQKNWALSEILTRHASGEDYCLILEHHDDVLVLDAEDSPTRIDFFQVKSRDGTHWTLSQLLKRTKGEAGPKLSHLGRLVLNKQVFREHVGGLHFVSNLPFHVPLASGQSSVTAERVRLSDVASAQLRRLRKRLAAEHAPEALEAFEDCTVLIRCALPLKEHDEHIRGRIATFLEARTPGAAYPIPLIHRALFDEVRRKTNYQGECHTPDDLIAHKSISRRSFEAMLTGITRRRDIDELWADATQRLTHEGMPFHQIVRMKGRRTSYELDLLDRTNVALTALRRAVVQAIFAMGDADTPLRDVITHVRGGLPRELAPIVHSQGVDYVNCCIVLEYLACHTGTGLSPADPQSEADAA